MGKEDTPGKPGKPMKMVVEPGTAAFLHAHGYDGPLELNTRTPTCPSVDRGNLDVHDWRWGDPVHLDELDVDDALATRAAALGISGFMPCLTCGWVEPIYEAKEDDEIPQPVRDLIDKLTGTDLGPTPDDRP